MGLTRSSRVHIMQAMTVQIVFQPKHTIFLHMLSYLIMSVLGRSPTLTQQHAGRSIHQRTEHQLQWQTGHATCSDARPGFAVCQSAAWPSDLPNFFRATTYCQPSETIDL